MELYFAPMEGITGYVYRQAHQACFDGIAEYYTPFLAPNQNHKLTSRELSDILPEHNADGRVIPQILTNKAEDFLWAAEELKQFGYDEVNLNLGCPSGTVVAKMRGAGFLAMPRELEVFLSEVSRGLESMGMALSVKTRIGKEAPSEFEELLSIYNQFSLKKLIIHPRVQTDYYKNHPNLEVFHRAVEASKNPICYNGDLFSVEDVRSFLQEFPQIERLMLGRGLLTNPALAEMVKAQGSLNKEDLLTFHDRLLDGYRAVMSGDKNVLFKMKEVWFYLGDAWENSEKYCKKIKKAERMVDYERAVSKIFAELTLKEAPVFGGWRK